jgi:hypothetical protein
MTEQEKQKQNPKKPENAFKSFEDLVVPTEFSKIINDFIADIVTTFPEYTGLIKRWWSNDESRKQKEETFVFRHCVKTIPERFFDILYKNAEMFGDDSETNTEFLPGIVFKQLWKCDISDTTRETIWKYLQLILFSVIGSVHNSDEFGDTAKLFEAINEDELKTKLSETLDNMSSFFEEASKGQENTESNTDSSKEVPFTPENMPNVEELHGHLNSLMGGKLGKLAMELAEDTASQLDLNMDDTSNPKDVFQKLFKNPGKLMNMVKNIGGKIESKIKSGEIKESELMSEGMDLLNKMKSMPGMGDMSKIFSQMGIPGLDKNTKVNMGAMEAQMNKTMKMAKMKERMRSKAEQKAQTSVPSTPSSSPATKPLSEDELIKIFSSGEKAERTPRGAKPPQTLGQTTSAKTGDQQTSSKKKKGKK